MKRAFRTSNRALLFLSVALVSVVLGVGIGTATGQAERSSAHEVITARESARAVALGNVEQARALEDGQVTYDEYRRAMSEVLDCLGEAGVAVSELMPSWSGAALAYQYSGDDRAERIHDTCYERHAQQVDIVFQTSDSVEEIRQGVYSAVARCLRAEGIDIPFEYDPSAIFRTDREDIAEECLTEHRYDR